MIYVLLYSHTYMGAIVFSYHDCCLIWPSHRKGYITQPIMVSSTDAVSMITTNRNSIMLLRIFIGYFFVLDFNAVFRFVNKYFL